MLTRLGPAAAAALLFLAGACESGGGGDGDGNGNGNGNGNDNGGGDIGAGVSIAGPSGDTSETGASATFTVVLDAAPSAVVTVAVDSADTGEVAVQSGESLVFTPANWNAAQTVTVVGVDDQLPDGPVSVTLTATANTAGGYDGERATVVVVNQDDGRELASSRDNTLIEVDPMGADRRSNGAGQYVFAGRTGQPAGSIRRGLVRFDIAGVVPAGAVISAATLRLTLSKTQPGTRTLALRRMLRDWGEQGSDAPGEEGGGAAAEAGDATWTHRFHDTAEDWSVPGGAAGTDFSGLDSATADVGGPGQYEWTGTTLVSDVQDMLDNPGANHGWMLLGDESAQQTVKRFDTREHPSATNRPLLLLEY